MAHEDTSAWCSHRSSSTDGCRRPAGTPTAAEAVLHHIAAEVARTDGIDVFAAELGVLLARLAAQVALPMPVVACRKPPAPTRRFTSQSTAHPAPPLAAKSLTTSMATSMTTTTTTTASERNSRSPLHASREKLPSYT